MSQLYPPLTTKNGRVLMVLAICRISTLNQDVRSLADQEASYRRLLDTWVDGRYEMTTIASQGSGENIEREEYLAAIDRVESGQYDLVITEDMGRLCRRVHAHIFAETCEDNDTRLIALNDHIDTARDDWRLHSYFAVMRHESYNRDTSARIRRSHRHRFMLGGVVQCTIFGYLKKAGSSNESDLAKDPAAEPIYDEWFRRLESGGTYAEVADWLNSRAISPGPFARINRWTTQMVGRITHNPILKGLRVRNDKIARRINKSGKHITVKAPPEERLERNCPHLAFVEPDRYDRVIAKLKLRNGCYRRKGENGIDPRKGVSRKKTVWPGQHVRCAVCNRPVYWYGVGDRRLMKCSGSQNYLCWNGAEFHGDIAAKKMVHATFKLIQELPGFDNVCIEKARQQWREQVSTTEQNRTALERRCQELGRQIVNVTDAIAVNAQSRALPDKLKALEDERDRVQCDLGDLIKWLPEEPVLPSVDIIRKKAEEIFTTFAPNDPEVGRLLHILVPVLEVYPVQLCDGGQIVLRARMVINLAALAGGNWPGAVPEVFTREITVDLFEPPQREKHRKEIVCLRKLGMTEKAVAARLKLTITAAQRAANLQRLMDSKGLTDPYIRLIEPPTVGNLTRHLHPRYRFVPLKTPASED